MASSGVPCGLLGGFYAVTPGQQVDWIRHDFYEEQR